MSNYNTTGTAQVALLVSNVKGQVKGSNYSLDQLQNFLAKKNKTAVAEKLKPAKEYLEKARNIIDGVKISTQVC